MDIEQNSEVAAGEEISTVSESSTPAPSETITTNQASSDGIAPGEALEAPVTVPPPMPTWAPNFKYKAMGQEHEIDEDYRSYIKSQEDEKKIKRLFEQFQGAKALHEEVKSIKTEHVPIKQELQSYKQGFEAFNQLAGKGDFIKAFDLFKIPKAVILQAAKQHLDFDELPQQHREAHHQLTEQEQYNAYLQQQLNEAQAKNNQMATQSLKSELTNVLSRPDVKTVSERYDQVNGPDAFKNLVKERGLAHFAMTQGREDLTATQVVDQLLGMMKPFMAPPQAPAAPAAPREVPVIPATGNSSSSVPGQAKAKRIDDLKKLAEKYTD